MFRDGPERCLVFGVGAERFAVALAAVDEVIDAPVVTPMPDAPRSVLGVAAARGGLVTLHDPGALLGVTGATRDTALLFVRRDETKGDTAERRTGLVVDALYDTLLVDPGDVRPAPGMDAVDRVLVGIVRRGTDLIAVLEAGALLDALERDAAPGSAGPTASAVVAARAAARETTGERT